MRARFIFCLFMVFFAVTARAMEDEKKETNFIDIENLDEDVGRSSTPKTFSDELDNIGDGAFKNPEVLASALAKRLHLHDRYLPDLEQKLKDKTDHTKLKQFLFSDSGKKKIKKKGLEDLLSFGVSNLTKDPSVPLSVVKLIMSAVQNKGEDDQRNIDDNEVRSTENNQLITKQKKTIQKKNRGLLASLGCNSLIFVTGIVAFGTLGLEVYTAIKGCSVDGVNGVETNSTQF